MAAARRETAEPTLLARGADGVIILDVSGSVGPREYRQVVEALDEAAASGRRYGLVAFSDVAYEVFPPGSDPAQVRALRRFFTPLPRGRRQRLGVLTSGGRVLCVTALADSVKAAQHRAYEVADAIQFDGAQYRRDIGHRALKS